MAIDNNHVTKLGELKSLIDGLWGKITTAISTATSGLLSKTDADGYYQEKGSYATPSQLNSLGASMQGQIDGKVSKAGDTMTGNLTVNVSNNNSNVIVKQGDYSLALSYNIAGDRGIWDSKLNKWILSANNDNVVSFNGNASTASKCSTCSQVKGHYTDASRDVVIRGNTDSGDAIIAAPGKADETTNVGHTIYFRPYGSNDTTSATYIDKNGYSGTAASAKAIRNSSGNIAQIGSSTKPVYVDSSGKVQACGINAGTIMYSSDTAGTLSTGYRHHLITSQATSTFTMTIDASSLVVGEVYEIHRSSTKKITISLSKTSIDLTYYDGSITGSNLKNGAKSFNISFASSHHIKFCRYSTNTLYFFYY